MFYRTTRIYRRSIELTDFVVARLDQLPAGYSFLADQLRRAVASISLNYIEGCGRPSVADRRRFFHIAAGSALEITGILDVMHHFRVLSSEDLVVGQDLADHIASMLRHYR